MDIARRTVNIGMDSLMQRSTPEQQLGCCAYDAVACSQLACTRHNAYTAHQSCVQSKCLDCCAVCDKCVDATPNGSLGTRACPTCWREQTSEGLRVETYPRRDVRTQDARPHGEWSKSQVHHAQVCSMPKYAQREACAIMT